MKKSKTLNLTKTSIMTVILILCSWITIPFPIPFTLQTFGVYAALLLLGGKIGTLSLTLYILLGAAGLPVFSSFSSGAGHLLSPTGGYIWGFLLCALLYVLTEKITAKSNLLKATVLFAGTLLCYTAGTLRFVYSAGNSFTLRSTLTICVFPYIVPDLLKLLSAFYLTEKVKPILNKITKE